MCVGKAQNVAFDLNKKVMYSSWDKPQVLTQSLSQTAFQGSSHSGNNKLLISEGQMDVYHLYIKPHFLENKKIVLHLVIFSDQALVLMF